MTFGLVHASYILPKWQAVKLTFFAPYYVACQNFTLRKCCSAHNGHWRFPSISEKYGSKEKEKTLGAFHSTKLSKIWKQWQMVQTFPKQVSRNYRNCWICEMRITQPKILDFPGAKLNGKKTFRKKFPKLWVHLARLASLWKFWKMLFHSPLEVALNSNWTFWLNGKCPLIIWNFTRLW